MSTDHNETAAETATPDAMAFPTKLTNFIPKTLTVGDHPATVIGARITANANGKPYIELDCQLDHGPRRQHQMYVSTEAAKNNTARQLNRAFGINSFRELPTTIGQKCSLRAAEEEYKGKVSIKTVFVNPYREAPVDLDLDALDDGFTAAAKTLDDVAF